MIPGLGGLAGGTYQSSATATAGGDFQGGTLRSGTRIINFGGSGGQTIALLITAATVIVALVLFRRR